MSRRHDPFGSGYYPGPGDYHSYPVDEGYAQGYVPQMPGHHTPDPYGKSDPRTGHRSSTFPLGNDPRRSRRHRQPSFDAYGRPDNRYHTPPGFQPSGSSTAEEEARHWEDFKARQMYEAHLAHERQQGSAGRRSSRRNATSGRGRAGQNDELEFEVWEPPEPESSPERRVTHLLENGPADSESELEINGDDEGATSRRGSGSDSGSEEDTRSCQVLETARASSLRSDLRYDRYDQAETSEDEEEDESGLLDEVNESTEAGNQALMPILPGQEHTIPYEEDYSMDHPQFIDAGFAAGVPPLVPPFMPLGTQTITEYLDPYLDHYSAVPPSHDNYEVGPEMQNDFTSRIMPSSSTIPSPSYTSNSTLPPGTVNRAPDIAEYQRYQLPPSTIPSRSRVSNPSPMTRPVHPALAMHVTGQSIHDITSGLDSMQLVHRQRVEPEEYSDDDLSIYPEDVIRTSSRRHYAGPSKASTSRKRIESGQSEKAVRKFTTKIGNTKLGVEKKGGEHSFVAYTKK